MPNAALAMTSTKRISHVIRRAKARARIGTTGGSTDYLTSADANNELVDQYNDAVSEVLSDFPNLNSNSSYAGTAANGYDPVPLPTDMAGADIYGIYLPDGLYPNTPLTQITEQDVLAKRMADSEGVICYSACVLMYTLNMDGTLSFYPKTDAGFNFTVLYRKVTTPATLADITAAETAGAIIPVPDAMEELLILKLAQKLVEMSGGATSAEAQALSNKYEAEKWRWVKEFVNSPDSLRTSAFGVRGYPGTARNFDLEQDIPALGSSY